MKALLLTAPSTFAFTDVPTPVPGPGEVLVDVRACGICGSDIHGMDGRSGRRIPPIVMGHEAAGIVAATGEGTDGWKAGDRITFDSTEFCGECEECQRGNFNLCASRKVLGVSCGDYRRHGCFAEQVVLPARILHRIPDSLSFEKAAFAEPVAIALHAVNLAPETKDEPVIVVGAGLIGLLVIQALKARGWEKVIAVDLDDSRLALAKELGATHAFSARLEGLAASLRELCGGDGAAVAFEVVGAAAPVDLAIRSVRKGGTVVLVGNLQPSVPMPLQEVVTRQISLKGSCACAGEYPEAIRRIEDGSIRVEPLLSATVPLEEGGEWFARLANNTEGLLKVILTMKPFDLTGRVALVTGTSRGLGERFALTLAEAGADIIGTSRDIAALDGIRRKVEELGRKFHPVALDVGSFESIQSAFATMKTLVDRVDILVNNAGCNVRKPATEITWEDWNLVMDTNLRGTFFVAQQVAAGFMIPAGYGRIINIGSVTSVAGYAGLAPYCASRGGTKQLTMSLADDWGIHGITVNCLAPGWFKTAQNAVMYEDKEWVEYLSDRIPLKRPGQTGDLDGPLLFLASEESRYMTGQLLLIDGGISTGATRAVPKKKQP